MKIKYLKYIPKIIINPKILLSKYDSFIENIDYREIIEMYTNNLIKEYLVEDIFDLIGLKKIDDKITLKYKYESRNNSISAYELKIISLLCKNLPAKNILEIGTYEGRTTVNIACNSNTDCTIYTIDLPQSMVNYEIGRFIKKNPDEKKKIIMISGDSKDIDYTKLPQMNIIFIDGDHSYNGVASDTKNAFNIVSKNGIILWHDFDRNHLGSTKAIIEGCNNNNFSYYKIAGTNICIGFK